MVFLRSLAVFVLISLLAACGEVREDLGLGRSVPDEFAVVEHPPLSMPPDFGLRPPRPGAPSLLTVNTNQAAKDAVLGASPAVDPDLSPAEKALLIATGGSKAPADIRDTVDRESAQKVVASPHLVDRLTDWHPDKQATTVDAEAEAERIQKAKDSNQPVAKGATPVIEKQQTGWLGL